jgi:hypothetical protein
MLSADVNAKEQAFVGGHRSIVALAQSLRLKGRSKNHALQRMMVAAKISSPGHTAPSRLQPANIPAASNQTKLCLVNDPAPAAFFISTYKIYYIYATYRYKSYISSGAVAT